MFRSTVPPARYRGRGGEPRATSSARGRRECHRGPADGTHQLERGQCRKTSVERDVQARSSRPGATRAAFRRHITLSRRATRGAAGRTGSSIVSSTAPVRRASTFRGLQHRSSVRSVKSTAPRRRKPPRARNPSGRKDGLPRRERPRGAQCSVPGRSGARSPESCSLDDAVERPGEDGTPIAPVLWSSTGAVKTSPGARNRGTFTLEKKGPSRARSDRMRRTFSGRRDPREQLP